MPHPPLPIGRHGHISFRAVSAARGERRVRAAVYVRDHDGRRREVTASGTSKAAARDALLRKLDQRGGVGGELTADTLLQDVAQAWLAEVDRWRGRTRRAEASRM